MPNPKAVNAAKRLFKTLYTEKRGPSELEYTRIVGLLDATDGRTRIDPSKRKKATRKKT